MPHWVLSAYVCGTARKSRHRISMSSVLHLYCICNALVSHRNRISFTSVSHQYGVFTTLALYQYHISNALSPRRHCISIVSVWHRYHIVIASAYLGVLQTRNMRTMKNRTIALRVSSFSCLALASLAPRFCVDWSSPFCDAATAVLSVSP